MSSVNFIFKTVKWHCLVRYYKEQQEKAFFLSTFQVIEVEVRDKDMSFQSILKLFALCCDKSLGRVYNLRNRECFH